MDDCQTSIYESVRADAIADAAPDPDAGRVHVILVDSSPETVAADGHGYVHSYADPAAYEAVAALLDGFYDDVIDWINAQRGLVPDGVVKDETSGVHYFPWVRQGAVGYHAVGDGVDEYIYLNPSTSSDDGVPNVFLYQGADGDPAQDAAAHHYVVGEQ